MTYSFRTNGDYVDFVHTDDTSLHVETVILSLENTSRSISWSLLGSTDRISFSVDGVKYENILITEIDFDGTPMDSQDDFETGITAMFPGLAGGEGGETIILKTVTEITDAQIKALPTTPITLVAQPGVGKMIIPIVVNVFFDYTANYANINAAAYIGIFPSSGSSGLLNLLNEAIDSGVTNFLQYEEDVVATFVQPRILQSNAIAAAVNPVSDFTNRSLQITAFNDSNGDFTEGNAANRFYVTVYYVVVDL